MLISIYSIFVSLVIFNIWVASLIFFERNNRFIKFFGIEFLLILSLLCIFRMVFAIEFPFAKVIRSDSILPPVMDALNYRLFTVFGVDISPLRILIAVVCIALIYGLYDFVRQMYYYNRLIGLYKRIQWDIPERIRTIYADVVKELGFKRTPQLVCNDISGIPFAAGFIKPMVFIPPVTELSDNDIKYIFRHELTHIKNKDILVKLMCSIFCSLMWWNPLVHILKQDISQILEIKCDLRVCNGLDVDKRASYLRTIINFIGTMSGKSRDVYYTSAMTKENERCLIQRFDLVLEDESYRNSKIISFTSFAVMLVMLVLSYSFVFQPHYEPSYSSDNAVYFTKDNTRVVYEDGVYKVYIDGVHVLDADESMLESLELSEIEIEGK